MTATSFFPTSIPGDPLIDDLHRSSALAVAEGYVSREPARIQTLRHALYGSNSGYHRGGLGKPRCDGRDP